jgi:acyl transferase domain-containing protein
VSSFGIGGTNAHVILEEYPQSENKKQVMQSHVLPLSAKTEKSLLLYQQALLEYLQKHDNISLANIAFTLQSRREHFKYRQFIVCSNKTEAIEHLKVRSSPIKTHKKNPSIIFMFPGQGTQYVNMEKNLYDENIEFSTTLNQCLEIISRIKLFDAKSIIFPESNAQNSEVLLNNTEWTQPLLFSISYALAKQFETWGITPTATIGHSLGEYVAATLAGVFTLEDALKIVVKRGELMQSMPCGCMLSIQQSSLKVQESLAHDVAISVVNSPNHCVISGSKKSILRHQKTFEEKGINFKVIKTFHAFHSSMMEEIKIPLEKFIANFTLLPPIIPFVSNVSGDIISNQEAISAAYWAEQLRQPVQFSKGIETLIRQEKNSIFLEIGPGSVLTSFVRQHHDENDAAFLTVSSLTKINNQTQSQAYQALGRLWCYGYPIQWNKTHKNEDLSITRIPGYQFERLRCWIDEPKTQKIMYKHQTVDDLQSISSKNIRQENNIENIIHSIWTNLLGVNIIKSTDDFFELGGHLLLAIQCVGEINKSLAITLTVSDLFKAKTIEQLVRIINEYRVSQNNCKLLKPLTPISDMKENLFFIHPSNSGCEVYQPLADKLSSHKNCIGIENHNLSAEDKISSLSELAKLYLSKIEVYLVNREQKITLCGWSLGGLIALEIACHLESLSFTNIQIILFDTKIPSPIDVPQIEKSKKRFKIMAKKKKYPQDYIDKVISGIPAQSELATCLLT